MLSYSHVVPQALFSRLQSRVFCCGLRGSGGLRVRLEAREVRLDHLEHADDAAVLGLHARVRGVEDLRLLLLLDQRGRLAGLLVEPRPGTPLLDGGNNLSRVSDTA